MRQTYETLGVIGDFARDTAKSGIPQAALTIGTGAAGQLAGGLAGISRYLYDKFYTGDERASENAANVSQKVSQAITVEPISTSGENILELASLPTENYERIKTNAANYNKNLLADCQELDALKKFVGNARNEHYAMTLPWSDMGLRLIPTAKLFDYRAHMDDMKMEFDRLTKSFLDVYSFEVSNAMATLGNMFSNDDYPPLYEVESKFRWRLTIQPLADADDFRISINDEQARVLKAEYDEFYGDAIRGAANDIWLRLKKNLETLVRQLDTKDNGKPNKLYDSVFDTAIDLVHMMRDFNLTNDTQMESVRQQLESVLSGKNVEGLRHHMNARTETKNQVQQVLNSLPTLDF